MTWVDPGAAKLFVLFPATIQGLVTWVTATLPVIVVEVSVTGTVLVMFALSDPPVFVRGVPLDWMLDVTVPDTTHGFVLWVTATGFVMVVRVPMLVTVPTFQVPLCVAATVPVTVTAFVIVVRVPMFQVPDWVAATVHDPLCVTATVPDTLTVGVF